MVLSRGGVLEDVLGLEDVLEGPILKSLASQPQVLENCPVLGSRTVLFLNSWNFVRKRHKPCGKSAKIFFLVSSSKDRLKKNFWRPFSPEKNFWRPFFWDRLKKILRTFFWRNTCVCVLGLGLERVCSCPWLRKFFVSLASSLVSSTPPLVLRLKKRHSYYKKILLQFLGSAKLKLWNIQKKSQQHLPQLKHNLRWFTLQSMQKNCSVDSPRAVVPKQGGGGRARGAVLLFAFQYDSNEANVC